MVINTWVDNWGYCFLNNKPTLVITWDIYNTLRVDTMDDVIHPPIINENTAPLLFESFKEQVNVPSHP